MARNDVTKAWFGQATSNPHATLRLFCFPHAGADAAIFRSWREALTPFADVHLAHLPGRGSRFSEAPFMRLSDMVETLAQAIKPYIGKPFAFFGHSMGALISFELARLLRNRGGPEPSHLFISGRSAPQLMEESRLTYNLPEPEFVEELRRLNGTPRDVLEHPEMMELMIPILRADFSVCQTYRYEREMPLSYPITVFGGLEDLDTRREHLEQWDEQTTSTFTLQMFPGDHFFINEALPQILETIRRQLHQKTGGIY